MSPPLVAPATPRWPPLPPVAARVRGQGLTAAGASVHRLASRPAGASGALRPGVSGSRVRSCGLRPPAAHRDAEHGERRTGPGRAPASASARRAGAAAAPSRRSPDRRSRPTAGRRAAGRGPAGRRTRRRPAASATATRARAAPSRHDAELVDGARELALATGHRDRRDPEHELASGSAGGRDQLEPDQILRAQHPAAVGDCRCRRRARRLPAARRS